ncbi:MAG: hypothetical protein HOH58_07830 [Opitutaceae bacterium]|nr:hypothetical protein [Opitutaceae bacterium]
MDRPGHEIRLLKEGYWDHTAVVEMPDGSVRVRKQAKSDDPDKIWGVESLRREIHFLQRHAQDTTRVFPPLLEFWDRADESGNPQVGYEIPFFTHHRDVGSFAREAQLEQNTIDDFQEKLAEALLMRVHHPVTDSPPLSRHLKQTVHEALLGLTHDPLMIPLVEANEITLNGRPALGPRAAWDKIVNETEHLASLDAAPTVQLHGDFFLENILWAELPPPAHIPQLILIDPVSVAGVVTGPAVFDLVKYESYATGELLGLRSEWVDVSGFDESGHSNEFHYTINWNEPGLKPFRDRNWHGVFHQRFVDHHGPINRRHYQLIDGYFSVAMALNTSGKQRKARLLKAVAEFADVLGQ